MGSTSSLYAAIDLGSNSFHMLVVREVAGSIQTLTRIKRKVRLAAGREVAGSIQTLTRIKRKVRLAAGLNSENALANEAMERGWQCLRLFAERLQDITPPQIRVVATATLRLAVNAGDFIAKAQEIHVCKISLPRKFALSLRRHYDLPSMRVILLPKRRKSSVVRYR